ncbi:tetraspan tm4sf, partial [Lynx pardinus]
SSASHESCSMPLSCCTKDSAEDVINTQCGHDARQKPEVDQQIVICTKGCVLQFETGQFNRNGWYFHRHFIATDLGDILGSESD